MAPSAPPPLGFEYKALTKALSTPDDIPNTALALTRLVALKDDQLLSKDPMVGGATLPELVALTVALLHASDMNVKAGAARLLARLATAPETHDAMRTQDTVRTLWSILVDFSRSFDAYKKAWDDLGSTSTPSSTVATPEKAGGKMVTPIDPESFLPGPSKMLVEGTLRTLQSLAFYSTSVGGWLYDYDLAPALSGLRHHSLKVQMRTAQLVQALARGSPDVTSALLAAHAAPALLQLLRSSRSASVKLCVMQVLTQLVRDPGLAHAQLQAAGAVDTALHLLLAPQSGVAKPYSDAPPPPPPPPPACGGGKVNRGTCAAATDCCSSAGYCGTGQAWCGVNCVGGACTAGRPSVKSLPSPPPPSPKS